MTIPQSMRNVSNKMVQKIKRHFMFNNVFRKSRCLWDNVDKCDGARGVANYDTIWRIRVACSIRKLHASKGMHMPTRWAPARTHMHAHTETYIRLNAFPWQQWSANAPQCYVIHSLDCQSCCPECEVLTAVLLKIRLQESYVVSTGRQSRML
jgi:hypothetical protein